MAGVDVLGIIKREIDRAGGDAYEAGRELIAVQAAVAELIEACAELKDVCNRPSAARTRAQSWRRLDAALRNVQGGA